ncbi:thermonuclease family protein [Sphingomicrobium lutaoense]|uniref:Endonuclease YncB(Thermonuclease family) n=1 Tax=Sphingomicrobium lutaoense TaxID=515949 RepID=A0A839YWD6_9SPHN|nr:thermonuclease family protein [Sphingomicrobium lutaoense]MBB3764521.1 endonuclease YncB(thermonuclease family) [Sphingomicrobium lutaoense]
MRGKRSESISWTFVGIVALIAALGGTAVGIGMAREDGGGRAGQIIEEVASSFTGGFSICHEGGGYNCVVDGDTIYIEGQKIRILDIDAPETHDYRCPEEKALGDRATRRLHQLVNSGQVTAARAPGERDEDRYGRKLSVVMVDGVSVGNVLVGEGLARPYGGGRRSWC